MAGITHVQAVSLVKDLNIYQVNNEQLEAVIRMLNTLASCSQQQFLSVFSEISIHHLFEVVFNINKKCVSDACQLLKTVLKNSPIEKVMEHHYKAVAKGLFSPTPDIQETCIHQLLRFAENNPFNLISYESNVCLVFQCLGNENLTIAAVARKIINVLASKNEHNLGQWFFSKEVLNICFDLLNKNATIRHRVYEIFADLLSLYPKYIDKCGIIFDKLFQDLMEGNDILSQLNSLQLVAQISTSSPEGFQYGMEKFVFNWAIEKLSSEEPFIDLLIPGIIKLFGNIFHSYPSETIEKYEAVTKWIFGKLDGNDNSLRFLCAETVAFVASNSDALRLLYKNNDLLAKTLHCMFKMITEYANNEHGQRKVLDSLSDMFSHNENENDITEIIEQLYWSLDSTPLTFLFSVAKQPFTLLKNGCLKVILVLCKYNWVQQDMKDCPGFMEYLLNRRSEYEKEGLELKYGIIKTLSISARAMEILGEKLYEDVTKYANEGPFYKESEVAVTYEGED